MPTTPKTAPAYEHLVRRTRELWMQAGRPDGQIPHFWLQALQQLLAERANRNPSRAG
jgi:hypothetical protein